ncbi:MAG: LiaF domain-containing protein [Candidatus Dormiibacterota bacterium]
MADRPPKPPTEEQLATPPDLVDIPPFEPLLDESQAIVQPPADPPVDISPAERERGAAQAARAASEGRLPLGDYADLLETLTETHERGEFDAALQEIASPTEIVPSAPPTTRLISVMGGIERKGAWQLASETTIVNVMGGCTLDLRGATVSGPVSTIHVYSVMGGIDMRIPPGVRVELESTPIMGGDDVKLVGPPPRQDAPTIRLVMLHVMGGSTIKDHAGLGELVRGQVAGMMAGMGDPQLGAHLRQARRQARHASHRARLEERRARHAARHDRDR